MDDAVKFAIQVFATKRGVLRAVALSPGEELDIQGVVKHLTMEVMDAESETSQLEDHATFSSREAFLDDVASLSSTCQRELTTHLALYDKLKAEELLADFYVNLVPLCMEQTNFDAYIVGTAEWKDVCIRRLETDDDDDVHLEEDLMQDIRKRIKVYDTDMHATSPLRIACREMLQRLSALK